MNLKLANVKKFLNIELIEIINQTKFKKIRILINEIKKFIKIIII